MATYVQTTKYEVVGKFAVREILKYHNTKFDYMMFIEGKDDTDPSYIHTNLDYIGMLNKNRKLIVVKPGISTYSMQE